MHKASYVGTPRRNIVVERKYRHLLETYRALLCQSHLLKKFWGDCLLKVTHLINTTSSKVLGNTSFIKCYLQKHQIMPNLNLLVAYVLLPHWQEMSRSLIGAIVSKDVMYSEKIYRFCHSANLSWLF